jgi:TolB-like protein/Flp pilus assembly protein TadD
MIGQTISHYKILEKLGEGGMGIVYKAQDTTLDRFVALKFLPPHVSVNEETKARFLQEAKAAAALNHNNICTIYGVNESDQSDKTGMTGGKMFIAMEYIEGGTLREKLPYAKIDDAITIAAQIGEALQEAHSKIIVHRDIKADNIMLTSKGQAKVMDFGLAKLKGSLKLTRTSSTVGTLGYMAPEQIQGGEVDHRSDIFSFGVLLFEMLTGKLPFRGEHEAAMIYSIVNEEPESVQKHRQDVSPEIDRIIHRALEKDPEDRYQSVADMVSELRRERKTSTKVIRPSLAEATLPHTAAAEIPADLPIVSLKRRVTLFSALGIGLAVVALVVYLFTGRHQNIDSLAVLPFENVGAEPNTEYLGDGITESLINTLSQLSNLSVMSNSAVSHFKGKDIDPQKAGKELGVRAVLRGRVTQRGDNLQISAELVDVSNNTHIWGRQYNKRMSDILTVQEDISKDIAQQLSLKLVGEDEKNLAKRPTENPEAYRLYLKGRFHWNKRNSNDLQKAVGYFEKAIEKDPDYALAYAGLASTYAVLPEYSGLATTGFIPKTEMAARKALELDATLAEPHAALGLVKYTYQWDWQGADEEFKRAIELDPNSPTTRHWYSSALELQGRWQEALSEMKRAQELDPLSPVITNNVGEILSYMRQYDSALEQFNKALELDPSLPGLHSGIAFVYVQQDRFDEAISELQKLQQIVGTKSPYGMGDLAYVYARAGRKAEAITILNRLLEFSKQGYAVAVQIATAYTALGDQNKAFEWLEKGYDEQNTQLGYLKIDPAWRPLQSDPRYAALLKKIRLDQ